MFEVFLLDSHWFCFVVGCSLFVAFKRNKKQTEEEERRQTQQDEERARRSQIYMQKKTKQQESQCQTNTDKYRTA